MKFKLIFSTLVFGCAVLGPGSRLNAQQPPTVNARFSALSFNARISDLYYFDNGNPKAISVYQSDIAGPYNYQGPPLLQFFRKGPVGLDGKQTWIPVAKASLPLNSREMLLLFYKTSDGDKESYEVTRMESFRGDFKVNELQIVNFSSMNVGGKFDDKQFQLLPGKMKKFAYPSGSDTEGMPVMLKMAAERPDGWKMVYSKPFSQVPGARRWIFIVETKDSTENIKILPFLERLVEIPQPMTTTQSPAAVSTASP